MIHESVDLIYNLVVLWGELGIAASEVWAEMDRRQALFGMAEEVAEGSRNGLDVLRRELDIKGGQMLRDARPSG